MSNQAKILDRFGSDFYRSLGLFALSFVVLFYNHYLLAEEALLGNNRYFLEDDLFYYLEIAWNYVDYGRWTFDGDTSTNGVQPLWGVVLSGLALVFRLISQSKNYFVLAALALSSIIGAGAILIHDATWRRVVDSSKLNSFLISLAIAGALSPFISNGMESPLKLFFLLSVMFVIVVGEQKHIWIVSALLFLAFVSRVDALVAIMLLAALLTKTWGLRSTVLSYGGFGLLAAFYALTNWVLTGFFLPVSGEVKRWWNSAMDRSIDEKVRAVQATFWREEQLFSERLFFDGKFGAMAALLLLFGFVIWHIRNIERVRYALDQQQTLYFVILIFLCSTLALHGFYVFETFRPYRWYFPEFYYASLFVFFLACSYLQGSQALPKLIVGTIALIVIVASAFTDMRKREEIISGETWGKAITHIVAWIDENTLPTDKIGVWSAGEIGYLSDRSVYNLEGLVADREMLSFNKDLRLLDYLHNKEIDYVIQWFPRSVFPQDEIPCGPLSEREWKRWYSVRLYVIRENCSEFRLLKVLELDTPIDEYAVYFMSLKSRR